MHVSPRVEKHKKECARVSDIRAGKWWKRPGRHIALQPMTHLRLQIRTKSKLHGLFFVFFVVQTQLCPLCGLFFQRLRPVPSISGLLAGRHSERTAPATSRAPGGPSRPRTGLFGLMDETDRGRAEMKEELQRGERLFEEVG